MKYIKFLCLVSCFGSLSCSIENNLASLDRCLHEVALVIASKEDFFDKFIEKDLQDKPAFANMNQKTKESLKKVLKNEDVKKKYSKKNLTAEQVKKIAAMGSDEKKIKSFLLPKKKITKGTKKPLSQQDIFVTGFIKTDFGKKFYQNMKQETKNNLEAALEDNQVKKKYLFKQLFKKQLEHIANEELSKEEIKKYLLDDTGKDKASLGKKKGKTAPSKFIELFEQAKKDFSDKSINPIAVGMQAVLNMNEKQIRSIDEDALKANSDIAKSALKGLKSVNLTSDELLICSKLLLILDPSLVLQVIKLLEQKKVQQEDIYVLINAVYDVLVERVKYSQEDLTKGTKGACYDLELVLSYPILLSSFRNELIYEKEKGNKLTQAQQNFLKKFAEKGTMFFDFVKKISKCVGINIDDVRRVAEWDENRRWCKINFVHFSVAAAVRDKKGRYLPALKNKDREYEFIKLSEPGVFKLNDIPKEDRWDSLDSSDLDEESYYKCFDADVKDILEDIKKYNAIKKKSEEVLYNFYMLFERQKILNAIKAFHANITNERVCPVCLKNDLKFVDQEQLNAIEKFLKSLPKTDSSVQSALNQLEVIVNKKKDQFDLF